MPRRTRIVATLGPATDESGVLAAVLAAGVDVVRINFSHGNVTEHHRRITAVREAARSLDRPIAILADLPGPKLRVVLDKTIDLRLGEQVRFPEDVGWTEPELLRDVKSGQRLLLDDGRLQLRALRFDGDSLVARVEVGGVLHPGKGINLPDTTFAMPALTPRDQAALAASAEAKVDWLALSFVRSASAANELRSAAHALGLTAPILAKIERPEAVAEARAILAAFDGIMVARGDLGVEIPLEQVPRIQKQLIRLARAVGKPVVTATDMLDSMRSNPRPTRAEASDVANAVHDGTDALMLSGETAIGAYPVAAVACMDRIADETETHLDYEPALDGLEHDIEEELAHRACDLARECGARAIIAPTLSGRTPRLVARHRPKAAIIAPADDSRLLRQLAIVWGVTPVTMAARRSDGADRLDAAVRAAFAASAVAVGDLVVVVACHPVEGGGQLPTLRVVRVADGGASASP